MFGTEKRWVVWRYETLKGKKTKIPYAITGKKASSTDESTWSDYDTVAKKANEDDSFDGVGIIFTPSQTLLGIDIDHCITGTNITHANKKAIQEFIESANTYCETSPSGEGLHILLRVEEPLILISNKKAPFEIYTKSRYFTVTNKPFGEVRDVRTITLAEAHKLLSIIGYPWVEKERVSPPTKSISVSSAYSMDDEQVLRRMFKSKNGDAILEVYNTKSVKDTSKLDASLCASLAFWTANNTAQIERLWMNSPLGSRGKTQTRKDYRDRTIEFAIKGRTELYVPPAIAHPDLDLLYVNDKDGKPKYIQSTENICRILRDYPEFRGCFRFDAFKNLYEVRIHDTWRQLQDADSVIFQNRISVLFPQFGLVKKTTVQDAMMCLFAENTFDSAIEYVKSLSWDGVPRLDTWLSVTYGTPDDIYHRAVGANWIKGLIKRIIEPGCKFDYVLVLEGKQGSKKSTSLAVLGGDWHVETTMGADTKDFFMQFQGNVIIEFSEGETLSRTEVKRLKAIITTQYDKFRPPYGHATINHPRRCVFAMTTNQSEYLKDETGNRRWLPVSVLFPQANVEWLAQNRDQLFAEAYHRVTEQKETIYEFPELETAAEQHKRRIEDPNTEQVVHWYYSTLQDTGRRMGITSFQVLRDALCGGFLNRAITKSEQMSIANILRDTLRLERRQVMEAGERMMKWYNPRDEVLQESEVNNLVF